ncbi:ATP-dependent bile acid permease [Paramyrothecium foliicola]|nr:ATP-dependent bile acid permease [Paramyrothecium foliicola]
MMNATSLQQISVGLGSGGSTAEELLIEQHKEHHSFLLDRCPAHLWPKGSYSASCPQPILVDQHHQEQLRDLHEALVVAISDIVRRWWSDEGRAFPQRMPLGSKEEDLLKWMDAQVDHGNLPKFSERLGSWRPDFMVEDFPSTEAAFSTEENFTITEINARFSFNGFMHEAYGQEALDKVLHAKATGVADLQSATNAETLLDSLFGLFRPDLPLHLLKGEERGIDIHMFINEVERRRGIKPRLIKPGDLRLVPDNKSTTGYRLFCTYHGDDDAEALGQNATLLCWEGEVVEEIHQVGLELHQRELLAMEPKLLQQLSLHCFNDMRTVLLVHDKRMLGIVKQELHDLVTRKVLSETQAAALGKGIVDTILPGSPEMADLLQGSAELRNMYILKPVRSGKGDGIRFGEDLSAQEWINALEGLQSSDPPTTATCVVQRRILPRLYESLRQKNTTRETKTRHELPSEGNSDKDSSNDINDQEAEDTKQAPTSRQAVVNLVGVDTERIAYFTQFQFMVVNGVLRLAIFSIFLGKLIGWIPFGAGVLAALLMMPLSTWLSYLLVGRSEKLMELRDIKLSKISEAISGIRQIKFSALESKWEERILALRKMELTALRKYFYADTALFACSVLSPILWASTSLAVYVFINGNLLPSVAFVSIGMFSTLEVTLETLPELFMMGIDGMVSIRRINAYLKGSEISDEILDGPSVQMKNATISWPAYPEAADKSRFVLRDINLSFPKGQLSVISGKSGEGKSLLAAAIIGEAELLKGSISIPKSPRPRHDTTIRSENWIIPGAIAYVGQMPWLESGSVRENILFGLPYVEARYDRVIKSCALSHDLAQLPDKSETDLGPNGVNLSGGQKWRVTLARAIYSRAEILVLEDVFSALDANVCRWILDEGLFGSLCESRTRILVTHSTDLVLPKARYHVEVVGGMANPIHLPDLVNETNQEPEQNSVPNPDQPLDDSNEGLASNPSSVTLQYLMNKSHTSQSPTRKFVLDETRNRGNVKGDVYLTYLRNGGGLLLCAVCAFLFIAFEAGTIGRGWWLRIWTSQKTSDSTKYDLFAAQVYMPQIYPTQATPIQPFMQHNSQENVNYYLVIYIILSLAAALVGILRYIWIYYLSLKASRTLFSKLLFATLHAPLQWLDSVPAGRIINRFAADFNTIDQRIPVCWIMFLTNLLRLLGICAASFFASLYLLPPAAILLFVGARVGKIYLTASRPLKRIESNAKSPIFELFGTTLKGIMTIRAFQNTERYIARMHNYLDAWTMSTFYTALANRYMSFRMALVAACFCIAVGLVIIFNTSIDAALAGFALSFVLDFSESIRWTIRCHGDLELDMNSMERIKEYMSLDTESLVGNKPPAAWPTSGRIKINNLEVSYAPDLPPVLKGISLNIGHSERIGIVGRTGAGKSSLALAIFRLIEKTSGNVLIDGLDISKVPVHDLRSRIAIIPQDPVLFSGTVRSNLDPFDKHADDELFSALECVHLKVNHLMDSDGDQISSNKNSDDFFSDLSNTISASGGNLSQGQRQLFCIARAILARPKLLIFDEATSAVDVATDSLVQQSIRSSFTDTTLIVIAHRLNTIADFDKVIVLENGSVTEQGTPRELLRKRGSFYEMYTKSGRIVEFSL